MLNLGLGKLDVFVSQGHHNVCGLGPSDCLGRLPGGNGPTDRLQDGPLWHSCP